MSQEKREKPQKQYLAKTEGGVEVLLSEAEYKQALNRKLAFSAGFRRIRDKSMNYPVLKILYNTDQPISAAEILSKTRDTSLLRESEQSLFSPEDDPDQLHNALATLTKRGMINVIRLPYSPQSKVHVKYELTDLGKKWVRDHLKAEKAKKKEEDA
jgi:DNA-binding PadR family transcriptional regulator